MVNKRFNRKFRRALGAALGALSVASISNIETIGAAFTETSLAGNAQIGDIFTMSKDDKKRIFDAIENDLMPQTKYGKSSSGILKDKDLGGLNLTHVSLSYPIKYAGFGHWDGAWNVTFKWNARPSVRITIIKTQSGLDGGADYLIIPAVNGSDSDRKNRDEYNKYIRTHDVPWIGNWIKEGIARPAGHAVYLQTLDMFGLQNEPLPRFNDRDTYDNSRGFDVADDPALIPKPPGAPPNWADANCLTRWDRFGLMDVSIWNKILGDDANIYKMYYDIKACPPELQNFYYPKKEENITTSNSSPAPVIAPPTMNMAPAMAALGVIPATIALANQPAPTPANVVANNNVTQGSNNVGAAPAAQNGSVSSGSTDIGTASQTGSDGKLTNVRNHSKPKTDLADQSKTLKT